MRSTESENPATIGNLNILISPTGGVTGHCVTRAEFTAGSGGYRAAADPLLGETPSHKKRVADRHRNVGSCSKNC